MRTAALRAVSGAKWAAAAAAAALNDWDGTGPSSPAAEPETYRPSKHGIQTRLRFLKLLSHPALALVLKTFPDHHHHQHHHHHIQHHHHPELLALIPARPEVTSGKDPDGTPPQLETLGVATMRGPLSTRLHTLLLFTCVARLGHPVCVDIPSETEAVLGRAMKLTCIACMTREEVKASTQVDWFYLSNNDTLPIPIYQYTNGRPTEVEGPWEKRLMWNGSSDLQDVSIWILNVTLNDSGTYRCNVFRQFEFENYTPSVQKTKVIELKVNPKAKDDPTALYSEVMMYVLLVGLTMWLLVEMVYCYRKISRATDHTQDPATNYLAIPSEQKDNPAEAVTE
ncbi:Sodium channel subunit beta-3 [Merluccius polli]|uniref:Sodium channel regulatory subunit beta-3 n=1 Tax=Merluccius polli TaxID=89951 RepID=A0AA47P302_MERPO|nr:Sodium channel subunit beta-3 [Merluccius polli]